MPSNRHRIFCSLAWLLSELQEMVRNIAALQCKGISHPYHHPLDSGWLQKAARPRTLHHTATMTARTPNQQFTRHKHCKRPRTTTRGVLSTAIASSWYLYACRQKNQHTHTHTHRFEVIVHAAWLHCMRHAAYWHEHGARSADEHVCATLTCRESPLGHILE